MPPHAARRQRRSHRTSPRPTFVLAALALSACTGRSGDPDTGVDRYSVNDTVVVHYRGASSSQQLLALTEIWRVGGDSVPGGGLFGRIDALTVDSAGDVWVFDGGLTELRRYSESGEFGGTVGRAGRGPGEYLATNGLATLASGQVAFWDAAASAVNIYGPNGTFIETLQPPVVGYRGRMRSLSTQRDGRLAFQAYLSIPSAESENSTSAWFIRSSDGVYRDTLINPASRVKSQLLESIGPTRYSALPVPFSPVATGALHVSAFTFSSPGHPYVVHAVWNGNPLRILRDAPTVEISDAERAELREVATWVLRRNDPAWRWEGQELPRTKPAVLGVRTSSDGALLVAVSTPSVWSGADTTARGTDAMPPRTFAERLTFDIYGEDGAYRGRIALPAGAQLHAMRGQDAWGSVPDEAGEQYLVRWRIGG